MVKKSFLYRVFLKKLLQLEDTPESIAWGASLGMFVAWTPTVGIQMIIIGVINTLFRVNRLAGIVMVYISNPLTLLPIYYLDYVVGAFLIGKGDTISREQFSQIIPATSDGVFDYFVRFFTGLLELGWDVALPTLLGGAVIGLVLAIPTYPLTKRFIERERAFVAKLRARRAKKKAEGGGAEGDASAVEASSADEGSSTDEASSSSDEAPSDDSTASTARER